MLMIIWWIKTWKSLSSTSSCGAILLSLFFFSEFIDGTHGAKHNFCCGGEFKWNKRNASIKMKHEFQEQSIQKMHPKSSAVGVELMCCGCWTACSCLLRKCNAVYGLHVIATAHNQPTHSLSLYAIWHGHKKVKQCKNLPVAIVAVADVVADTDDGWDSDVDDVDDMEFDIFELDESFLALVLFP